MKQVKFKDSYGKFLVITIYIDQAVCVLVGGETLDYTPNHPAAAVWVAMAATLDTTEF